MPKLILASGSAARARMLLAVGLEFSVVPAQVEERGFEAPSPAELSLVLAREKALAVSRLHQGALVIGADQVLDCEGEIFHKAKDRGEALEKLRALSGKTHSLHSAAAVAMDGAVLWAGREEARLTMRSLSEGDLRDYAGMAGEALTACAGGYAIEEAGAWLFERVEGDHFIIQGLPLLPLLGFLKSQYSF